MNQIKRRLEHYTSSIEQTKKLCNQLSPTDDPERNSINFMENLSNELFLEIFDYLDGCSLCEAFLDLNARFQHLLNHPSLRFKIIFTSKSKSILEYYSKNAVIPNKHRIISFRFNNTIDKFPLLSWFSIDSTFIRLESLTLLGIQTDELALQLGGLVHLPRLFSLTIRLGQHSIDIGLIYQLIFNLPQLKYYKFSSNVSNTNISSLKTNTSQFSSIEYLVIDHPCTLNDLITILSYTRYLSHLICSRSLSRSIFSMQQIQSMTLFNLTHIHIGFTLLRFDEFEIFIKPISSQLRVLKLYACGDASYLDADRWEKLILQHISQLNKFTFTYREAINKYLAITPYHQRIDRFNSAFWIQKQWLFHSTIRRYDYSVDVIIYDISSCSNRCADSHNYKTNTFISSIIYNPLFILNLPSVNYAKTFFNIIRPILLLSPINTMNIDCNEIHVGTLIDLIQSLPNLDFLVFNSLPIAEPRCLSEEEATAFRSISNSNKITRVNLQQLTQPAQIEFILDLCPRLQHLNLACCYSIDIESCLRFIFMEKIKYILNLSSFCLRISKIHEEIIENAQQIINLQKLHRHITMEQKDNEIYLRGDKQ